MMLIGTFRTIPLKNHEEEWGYMESEIEIRRGLIAKQSDKKGFVMREIALHIRDLCERTQTPKELWDFSPEPEIRQLLNLPESIPFR
jgi:hypothetical protein